MPKIYALADLHIHACLCRQASLKFWQQKQYNLLRNLLYGQSAGLMAVSCKARASMLTC